MFPVNSSQIWVEAPAPLTYVTPVPLQLYSNQNDPQLFIGQRLIQMFFSSSSWWSWELLTKSARQYEREFIHSKSALNLNCFFVVFF